MKDLLKGKGVRGAAQLAAGTAVGQVIIFLASPFLTRLYDPSELGALAVYAAILSTLVVVASFRYQLAIPLPSEESVARDLLILSLGVALCFSVVIAVILLPAGGAVARWTDAPILGRYFWMLPLSLLGASVYQTLNYWAIRHERFGLVARTRVTQSIGMAGTQVAWGWGGGGALGLLIGDAIGRAAGSGSMFFSVFREGNSHPMWSGLRLKAAAVRYRRFPILSTGSGLLNAAGLFSPPLLVAGLYGARAAGFFALAQRVVAVPVTLVGLSASQVFFGRAAELARHSRKELRAFVSRTSRRLFVIGLVPTAVIIVGGPWLFARIFGEAWREAGSFTQLLAPSFLLQFTVVPISQTLNVIERQDLQLVWDFLRFVIVLGSLAGPALLGWRIEAAVLAYGISSAAAYCLLFYWAQREAAGSEAGLLS